jgi:hypothetical protein
MTEGNPLELDSSIPPRLRPLVARLLEIERKCGTLGPRNEEARDMAARLHAIIAELSQGGGDGLPPPRFRELARQLFPVARLFESLGFMSVAREISHVERLLTEMDPAAPPPTAEHLQPRPSPQPSNAANAVPGPTASTADSPPQPRRRMPAAVVAALMLLVLAVVAAVAIIVRQQSGYASVRRRPAEPAGALLGESSAATAQSPAPAPAGVRPTPTMRPRARLADVIGEARLAEQAGDLDRAIDLLNEAAAIDVEAGKVRETAQDLVTALVARSDQAAAEAEWERAAALLERARNLALRFDLPTRPINEAARRQGGLERYLRLGPQDIAALRAAIGSKVTVLTHDGSREGRLVGVSDTSLNLQLGLEVADNGTLLHTGQVPLASVREVRVYPD